MKKRNLDYEEKFRTYLFNGDIDRYKEICKNINVKPNTSEENLKINEETKYIINLNKGVFINGILINEDIFQEEKVDYHIIEREQQIEDLYMWIGEAQRDRERENDVYLMKEDLKYLSSLKDELIFSSISTNEFIAKSDNPKEFNEICEEILKLNKEYKD